VRGKTHLTRPEAPGRGTRHRRPSDTPEDHHASYRITLDMYVGTTTGVLDRSAKPPSSHARPRSQRHDRQHRMPQGKGRNEPARLRA
jgi:hypothetical protein